MKFLGFLILLIIGLAIFASGNDKSKTASGPAPGGIYTPPPLSAYEEARQRKRNALAEVSINNLQPRTEYNVMTISFTARNTGDFDLKDFTVKCEHMGPSGTVMDQNTRTIYEVIPARGSKPIRNFNMGFHSSQSKNVTCSITDVVVGALRPAPAPKSPAPKPPAK